ncbi:MAG TPA: hypothetical protein VNT03_11375 [Baekduia sp.]|nr:hypothetical protein [Baekduia sp.]
MSTLTIILTHQDAEQADERMELLQTVAPEARFVLGHGGARSAFDQITWTEKFFVDDPTLRGPAQHLQSLNLVFETAWREYVAGDPEVDSLYVIEYDHLILDATFEQRLRELAREAGADMLGKTCVDATATNLAHYVRFRRDRRLLAHLQRVSVREDRERLFSCLGDGIWLTRRALEAYVDVAAHPPCYCEIYVPTLVHHLGFRVADVDAHSDLYHDVRWQPERSASEVLELERAGAVFVHPAKDQEVIRPLRELVLNRP